jgi:hypothetical protein
MGIDAKKTDKQITQRDIRMSAPTGLWDAFEIWMKGCGHKSISEGIRAAMIKVTGFGSENSQEKVRVKHFAVNLDQQRFKKDD